MKQEYLSYLIIFLAVSLFYYGKAQTISDPYNKTSDKQFLENEIVIYSNSFESPEDTIGWQRNAEIQFNTDVPSGGGEQSLYISGGCLYPQFWIELGPFAEDRFFSLRCWGKDLSAGGGVWIEVEGDYPTQHIGVIINKKEWMHYKSSELFCPAGKKLILSMGAGGFVSSAVLIDKVEIVKIQSTNLSWVTCSSGTTEKLNDVVMLDSSTAIVVGSEGSILKTTDSGKTWRDTAPSIDCLPGMDCKFKYNNITFFDKLNGITAGESVILITSDGGEEWQFLNSPSKGNFLCIGKLSLDNIYIGDDSGYVYNSQDTGKTWTSEKLASEPIRSIHPVRHDPEFLGLYVLEIFALTPCSLFIKPAYSTEPWKEWGSLCTRGLGSQMFKGQYSEDGSAFLVGAAGDYPGLYNILRLRPPDSHWYPVGPNNGIGVLYGLSIPTADVIYTCGSKGKVLKSANNGDDWVSLNTPTLQTLNSIYFFDNERGFAVGDSGMILYASPNQLKIDITTDKQIYLYRDTIQINITVTNTSDKIKVLEFNSSCQASYEIVDEYNWINDHGCLAVLSSLTLEPMQSFSWTFKYPDQTTPTFLEAGKYKIVGEILGYGKSDTVEIEVTKNNSSYFPLALNNEWNYDSNLFPHNEKITDTISINNKLYFGISINDDGPYLFFRLSGNKVFVLDISDSTEAMLFNFDAEIGISWELPENYACSFGLQVTLLSKVDTVKTPYGTFYNCYHFKHSISCFDAGITDTWFAEGIGKVRFKAIFFAGEGDFVLTDYNVTAIDNNSEQQKEISFSLFQNYPNPFNPSTTIKYEIPGEGKVELKIYDILGTEIASLVNDYQKPGSYEVAWNAKNFASGVYIYQIKIDSYVSSKKLILLK